MISPIFIILTIISATMVITSINPVHSIIWLVMAFIGSSIVFIQMEANFIALTVLIVYVGAIAILFVFVLMMLNFYLPNPDLSLETVLPISLILVINLLTIILSININSNNKNLENLLFPKNLTNIQTIGLELYSFYGYYLILASIILLVGMIGGILLTLNNSFLTKRQNPFLQINRDFHNISKTTNNFNN
uniref:NADH-ubiquinone oxidoreductase chain 6 n=1 Tax=Cassiopea andromeda TaxID=114796 RepID=G9ISC3_CASAN|nr:NADH dehydrogenase subunit 6 [Cassiopea andromeda]